MTPADASRWVLWVVGSGPMTFAEMVTSAREAGYGPDAYQAIDRALQRCRKAGLVAYRRPVWIKLARARAKR